jgi:hypothetical protein
LLLVGVAPRLAAQNDAGNAAAACAEQKDGVILTAPFSGPGDFARVLLCTGVTYRAETNTGGVRLSAKSILPGVQSPRFTSIMSGSSSGNGGGDLFKLLAYADGMYEIRAQAQSQGAQVTLKITRMGTK